MSDSPQNPQVVVGTPSININQGSREGVISKMFELDPKILNWVYNTFGDSHMEVDARSGETVVVPNSTLFQCPTCKSIKNRQTSLTRSSYLMCYGSSDKSKKERHEPTPTYPLNHRPILNDAGLNYLLGEIGATLNQNIGTANFSNTDTDTRNKISLEERLRYQAWYNSYTILSVIAISRHQEFVADWVLKARKLDKIFSVDFCTNCIINMTMNMAANSTKGKQMAAAGRVMDTRISTEAQTHASVDYQYPDGAAIAHQKSLSQRVNEALGR